MLSLSGKPAEKIQLRHWEIKGYYPYVPFLGKSLETGWDMLGVTDWIPARVPGCVHDDLLRAGWIDDPRYGLNSLACEWVENRWWLYRTRFSWDGADGTHVRLCFRGLDYKAHIYVNQSYVGYHEGMFEPVFFPVTHLIRDSENEVLVLFEHVPDEMAQIGHTSKTRTVKSRFAYKWDFCTHMVPTGIWDDAYLHATGELCIEEPWIQPEILPSGAGRVRMTARISHAAGTDTPANLELPDDAAIELTLRHQDETVASIRQTGKACSRVDGDGAIRVELEVHVPEIKKWYPNGYGDQPLYDVAMSLCQGDDVLDAWCGTTAFRTLSWEKNVGAPDDALPYTLVVNGERVYIKGVNLAPVDHFYGSVTHEQYEDLVWLLKQAHINFVRINGVGVIEKEDFYNLCDRHGILVWQDFIQSSSGIEDIPSKDPHFLELLKRSAVSAVLEKRNHVSLACWCGGNELKDAERRPIDDRDRNIAMLKDVVDTFDPGRRFFPSTSSGPNFDLDPDKPGQNHDVHGPWKYGGPENHYTLFNRSDSLFHSEFGVDGMASLRSLTRFLPPGDRVVTSMQANPTWRHHGEWWDTLGRDRSLFGDLPSLERFIAASQWIQAEGLRYALESNRRRKFQNSGSMIWQFNEPWPNVSNTCVVEYYGHLKMAYYWLRKAYGPLHLSLKYDKLRYRPGELFSAECFLHCSTDVGPVDWRAECLDVRGHSLWTRSGRVEAVGNSVQKIESVEWKIEDPAPNFFAVRLTVSPIGSDVGVIEENLYLFSTDEDPAYGFLFDGDAPLLEWEPGTAFQSIDARTQHAVFRVHNRSREVALYVHAFLDDEFTLFSPQNFRTLFPGESADFDIHVRGACPDRIVSSDSVQFACAALKKRSERS